MASNVLQTLDRLDVLVNNVGGFWSTRRRTPDGLEHTFALNHLAAFLLTSLLLERLKESEPARVVTVSSGAQAMGRKWILRMRRTRWRPRSWRRTPRATGSCCLR